MSSIETLTAQTLIIKPMKEFTWHSWQLPVFCQGPFFLTKVRPKLFAVMKRKQEARTASLIPWDVEIKKKRKEKSSSLAAWTNWSVWSDLLSWCFSPLSLQRGKLTQHSDDGARFGESLGVLGHTLVPALVVFLHPFDDEGAVFSQRYPCNTKLWADCGILIWKTRFPALRMCRWNDFYISQITPSTKFAYIDAL